MTAVEKDLHASNRRILSQALAMESLKPMQEHILKNCRIFCQSMLDENMQTSSNWSSPRNMTKWFSRLTFDIMGDIVFGRNWDVLKSERNRDLTDTFVAGTGALYVVSFARPIYRCENNMEAELYTID